MGTRHLTVVRYQQKNVVANYGQWDGYPDGQGRVILNFLREKFNREKFIKRLGFTYQASEDQVEQILNEVGGSNTGWITIDVDRKLEKHCPSIHRSTGGNILELIQDGMYTKQSFGKQEVITTTHPIPLVDESKFAKSGSCEWIWTVNLDDNTFSGYDCHLKYLKTWNLDQLPELFDFCVAFEDRN